MIFRIERDVFSKALSRAAGVTDKRPKATAAPAEPEKAGKGGK